MIINIPDLKPNLDKIFIPFIIKLGFISDEIGKQFYLYLPTYE